MWYSTQYYSNTVYLVINYMYMEKRTDVFNLIAFVLYVLAPAMSLSQLVNVIVWYEVLHVPRISDMPYVV